MSEQRMPTYDQISRALQGIAAERGEWAGMPISVLNHTRLVLEKRYPYQFEPPEPENEQLVNEWFCERYGVMVGILRTKEGKLERFFRPTNKAKMLIDTVLCEPAWLFEAEAQAMMKLGEFIGGDRLRAYIVTGAFVETSKRSKVIYLFRRLRPTIAMKDERVLCTLCLHPIGYYSGTFAGAMCPTDDVIAHLCMMRGDEPKFWANANQHPAHWPQSGI